MLLWLLMVANGCYGYRCMHGRWPTSCCYSRGTWRRAILLPRQCRAKSGSPLKSSPQTHMWQVVSLFLASFPGAPGNEATLFCVPSPFSPPPLPPFCYLYYTTLLTSSPSSVTTLSPSPLSLSSGIERLSTKPSPQSVQCSCADHKTGEVVISFPDYI